MKHRNSFAILAFSGALLLSACGGGGNQSSSASQSSTEQSQSVDPGYTEVIVTFDTDGGSAVPQQIIRAGRKATRPADPSKEGYTFVDWFRDPAKTMIFDFDAITISTNITIYAKWGSGEPSSSDSSGSESSLPSTDVIYFCACDWWNNLGGETAAKFDDAGDESFGTVMEYVIYDETAKLRYTRINIPENAATVTFYRVYLDQTSGEYKYGSNKTVTVNLSERGEHNMYTIANAGASWTNPPVTGAWATYGEGGETSSSSGETSSESSSSSASEGYYGPEGSTRVSWYLRGEGSVWAGGSDWTLGIQLFSNPSSQTDKGCILNITFAIGDLFKVTDGTTWFGYEKVDQYDSPDNKGRTNFEGDNDGQGGQNIKCTVAGSYDIYVNKDGKFWIQSHA